MAVTSFTIAMCICSVTIEHVTGCVCFPVTWCVTCNAIGNVTFNSTVSVGRYTENTEYRGIGINTASFLQISKYRDRNY